MNPNEMIPSFGRCGRITESLRFDVVSEAEVETKCRRALWPNLEPEDYNSPASTSTSTSASASSSPHSTTDQHQHKHKQKHKTKTKAKQEDSFQGTRCGVFPLPSNFKFSELHAVLIVHKTLCEDSELAIYHDTKTKKPKKNSSSHNHHDNNDNESTSSSHCQDSNNNKNNKNNNNNNNNNNNDKGINSTELSRHRARTGNYADRLGQFLTPFAFGVAPLVDIIATEAPSRPTAQGVKIPLFKMVAGRGERPIVEHILATSNRP